MNNLNRLIRRVVVIFIFITMKFNEATIIRRFSADATLYEEFSIGGKYFVVYSQTKPKEWKDMNALVVNHNMKEKAMLCTVGSGVWAAFPSANYKAMHGLNYQLIIGENCLPARTILSLQPLGEIHKRRVNGIIAFTEHHFGSEPTTIDEGSIHINANSLVYMGDKYWSLHAQGPSGPFTVCIGRSTKDEKVCIMPELDAALGILSGIYSISEGCEERLEPIKLELQTCFAPGVHKIIQDQDFNIRAMTHMCHGLNTHIIPLRFKEKFTRVMEIWEARIEDNIETLNDRDISIGIPASFKTDFLWRFMEVFKIGCPLVDSRYVNLLRNVFLLHLRTIWLKTQDNTGDVYQAVHNFLDGCFVQASNPTDPGVAERAHVNIACAADPEDSADLNIREADAFEEMVEGDKYDTVIESIWLILNFVSPYCNNINNYQDNEWSDLVSLFRQVFLVPVENQWIKPGDWLQYYPTMFNGYDLEKNRMRILTCVQAIQMKTPTYDPVGRTSAFNYYFQPSVQ